MASGEAHWWLEERRRVLAQALRRHPPPGDRRIFAAGDGARAMTDVLNEFGSVRLGEIPDDLPAPGEVETVAAFDVLERTGDDRSLLAELHSRLPAGGTLVLTVPAFEYLWGPHDELLQHRRRYSREELVGRLTGAGFTPELVSYFGAWLLPAVSARAIVRRFRGWSEPRPDFLRRPAPVDRVLTWLAASEASLVGRWSLPAGVAMVAIARKP